MSLPLILSGLAVAVFFRDVAELVLTSRGAR